MYTKEEFRKMVVDSDMPLNNILLVFCNENGTYIYMVSGFQEVDETIYDTDELYFYEVDKIIYESKSYHKVGEAFDFNINDIYEIKDTKTGEIIYRKNHEKK